MRRSTIRGRLDNWWLTCTIEFTPFTFNIFTCGVFTSNVFISTSRFPPPVEVDPLQPNFGVITGCHNAFALLSLQNTLLSASNSPLRKFYLQWTMERQS